MGISERSRGMGRVLAFGAMVAGAAAPHEASAARRPQEVVIEQQVEIPEGSIEEELQSIEARIAALSTAPTAAEYSTQLRQITLFDLYRQIKRVQYNPDPPKNGGAVVHHDRVEMSAFAPRISGIYESLYKAGVAATERYGVTDPMGVYELRDKFLGYAVQFGRGCYDPNDHPNINGSGEQTRPDLLKTYIDQRILHPNEGLMSNFNIFSSVVGSQHVIHMLNDGSLQAWAEDVNRKHPRGDAQWPEYIIGRLHAELSAFESQKSLLNTQMRVVEEIFSQWQMTPDAEDAHENRLEYRLDLELDLARTIANALPVDVSYVTRDMHKQWRSTAFTMKELKIQEALSAEHRRERGLPPQ